MKIHPLWYICIITRICLIFVLRYLHNKKKNKIYILIPLTIGLGFLYKHIFGSNNEIQFKKVFWHETRLIHSILYITSVYFFYNDNIKKGSLILVLDIIFSVLYRFITDI
jgi:hypothetical protein